MPIHQGYLEANVESLDTERQNMVSYEGLKEFAAVTGPGLKILEHYHSSNS